ncbi:uncharacterized protein [Pyxicephalus adspersus]|uniref:uncharacterized protein isoform X2 n=1 Tax=Pyxicephalus adspersus TaxID=30357 RepID=UPI003B5B0460
MKLNVKHSPNITCTAKNKLKTTFSTEIISCDTSDGLSWYLILAMVAGGVAFIIFIVLVVYSLKSCERPNQGMRIPYTATITDEEAMYSNRRQQIQERQLPQPPNHTAAPPPSAPNTEDIHLMPTERPPPPRQEGPGDAPAGSKGRGSSPKTPEPPQGHPQGNSLNQPCRAPQHVKPPLPGNHPNEQPPKPTPRTKSKPPRQNRKAH